MSGNPFSSLLVKHAAELLDAGAGFGQSGGGAVRCVGLLCQLLNQRGALRGLLARLSLGAGQRLALLLDSRLRAL